MAEGIFANRTEAGRLLAAELAPRFDGRRPVVLGLPRGGVPVAAAVADELEAPLDVLVVRKLPTPGQPELALGAVGEKDVQVVNEGIVRSLRLSPDDLAPIISRSMAEVTERVRRFRGEGEAVPLEGQDVIIVDDGMATGATMRAGVAVARAREAESVTAGVPVAGLEAVGHVAEEADEVVCLRTPRFFRAVGQWFADFTQVTEDEVIDLLAKA